MRELTMVEVLDVNGAGFIEGVIIGVFSNLVYETGKDALGALYDMRNNPGESSGSFYDLHF